jgi:hypothetical protein
MPLRTPSIVIAVLTSSLVGCLPPPEPRAPVHVVESRPVEATQVVERTQPSAQDVRDMTPQERMKYVEDKMAQARARSDERHKQAVEEEAQEAARAPVATVAHDTVVDIKPIGERRFVVTQRIATAGAQRFTLSAGDRHLKMGTQEVAGGDRESVLVTMTVRLTEDTPDGWATRDNLAFVVHRADAHYYLRFPPSFDTPARAEVEVLTIATGLMVSVSGATFPELGEMR